MHWAAYGRFDVSKPVRLLRGTGGGGLLGAEMPDLILRRLDNRSDICFMSSSRGSALHRWIITAQLTGLSEG